MSDAIVNEINRAKEQYVKNAIDTLSKIKTAVFRCDYCGEMSAKFHTIYACDKCAKKYEIKSIKGETN